MIKLNILFCFVLVACVVRSQSLIDNGDFEDNFGCPGSYPSGLKCPYIGNCVESWLANHGTPEKKSSDCEGGNAGENDYILCEGYIQSFPWPTGPIEIGEGIYQNIPFEPGRTYNLCFWVRSLHPDASVKGIVDIRLSDQSSTQTINACGQNFSGLNHSIFRASTLTLLNNWNFISVEFTVPEIGLQFDRIIFSALGRLVPLGAPTGKIIVHFDNVSLHEACESHLIINAPNTILLGGIHEYSDFIAINNYGTSTGLITNEPSIQSEFSAGNQIAIKAGFLASVSTNASFVLKIKPCSSVSSCLSEPCPDGLDGGSSTAAINTDGVLSVWPSLFNSDSRNEFFISLPADEDVKNLYLISPESIASLIEVSNLNMINEDNDTKTYNCVLSDFGYSGTYSVVCLTKKGHKYTGKVVYLR